MEQSERRSFIQEAADGQLKCSGCSVRCFGKKVSSNKKKSKQDNCALWTSFCARFSPSLLFRMAILSVRTHAYWDVFFFHTLHSKLLYFYIRDAILTDVFKAALTFMTNFRPASKYSGQSAGWMVKWPEEPLTYFLNKNSVPGNRYTEW